LLTLTVITLTASFAQASEHGKAKSDANNAEKQHMPRMNKFLLNIEQPPAHRLTEKPFGPIFPSHASNSPTRITMDNVLDALLVRKDTRFTKNYRVLIHLRTTKRHTRGYNRKFRCLCKLRGSTISQVSLARTQMNRLHGDKSVMVVRTESICSLPYEIGVPL